MNKKNINFVSSDAKSIAISILFLLLVSVSSVAFQGFNFGVNNNIFHIPIVLNYAGSIEGPHDLFNYSLKNFSSSFSGFHVTLNQIFIVFLFLYIFSLDSLHYSYYGDWLSYYLEMMLYHWYLLHYY